MYRIESFLSSRLFLQPRLVDNQIYFISNLGGHLSLYSMEYGGSVPEPLLPPHIALQNPHLLDTNESFCVFPKLGKIIVMLDNDGDENYQPMWIPLDGGFPEPTFENYFSPYRVHMTDFDTSQDKIYLAAESRSEGMIHAYLGDLQTGELTKLGSSPWGATPLAHSADHTRVALVDHYAHGDDVLYLWEKGDSEKKLLYGTPLEDRQPDKEVPFSDFFAGSFTTPDANGLLLGTSLHSDFRGLGFLDLENPDTVHPVVISGVKHQGVGELTDLKHLFADHYLLTYNIDGCSWLYEGIYAPNRLEMGLEFTIAEKGEISSGVLEKVNYDRSSDCYILSYSTATSPTQIYTVEGEQRDTIVRHTNERILGVPNGLLSSGEDASYTSFDGTRISAKLYFPPEKLGYKGPRPVAYYIHGGPQSQERPDFAWFSMPLILFLALNGFAVFVPNVRGSTGYGLEYSRKIDRDWGGDDRLDHIHAMTHVLPNDPRLDTSRAGVVGRSYGGYMTLTLAGRHPEVFSAAVDMFGPYDLITFSERIPETWKPYFKIVLGDPEVPDDRQFLVDRSPNTYLDDLACPLLVIQGKNDPRVVELESSDLVKNLRDKGKQIEYLLFENEGHDVLKIENRIACYNAITEFFRTHLKP